MLPITPIRDAIFQFRLQNYYPSAQKHCAVQKKILILHDFLHFLLCQPPKIAFLGTKLSTTAFVTADANGHSKI